MGALLRCVASALLVAAITVTGAPTAAAHTALTATEPPADATLTVGPSRVRAIFNEELQPSFAAMTVVGPDANLWNAGDPEVAGPVVSVAVRPLGPSGRYTVNYRVTSADGHVVSGAWSFTVTASTTAAPGPPASPSVTSKPIPLWPFVIGACVLIAGAAVWATRRRS